MEFEFALGGGAALLVWAAFYVFFAFTLMTIANKLGTENSWMAWIPILNIYLIVKMADRPGWWFLLLLVPLLNFFIAIYLWMLIAERRGRPQFWGILMIIPIVNLVIIIMLAFTEADNPAVV